jgi:hypothetical protein
MKVIIPLEIPDGGDVFFHLIKNFFHLTNSLFEIASMPAGRQGFDRNDKP